MHKEVRMKKIFFLIIMVVFLAGSFGNMSLAGDGPAPNSGDGIPDGSGFDKGADRDDKGAPNSGDCIPDGSGFDKGGALGDKGGLNFIYGSLDDSDEYVW
jgi:hypothetical protein